jgi:hypothetical protein
MYDYDWGGDILFSLQKCERSESGTGGAGDPKVAGLCPGDSASVAVAEDGSAVVSVSPGFMGGLASSELEISVTSRPSQGQTQINSVTIPGGSYKLKNLKAGDSVTMSYKSGSGRLTVTFILLTEEPEDTDDDTDDDQPPMVAAQLCAAIYTCTLDCSQPRESAFGDVTFLAWRCKTYDLSTTEEIPTPFSDGWGPPFIFSDEFQQCNVLLYVKKADDEDKNCAVSSCDDPAPIPSNYPPSPDLSKFDLWCPCTSDDPD